MNVLIFIASFILFAICQSLAIVGLKETFSKEHIFHPLSEWLDIKIKYEWIKKPLYKCVKCMASVYGALSFWGFVIPVFGFYMIEIPIFFGDVLILVYLNYFFYKRQ